MVSMVVSLCICLKFRTMQNALLRLRRQGANVQEVPVPQRFMGPLAPSYSAIEARRGPKSGLGLASPYPLANYE
jgi:hypothetical protein